MKKYYQGTFGVAYIFTANGSVLPKALLWAISASALCLFYNKLYKVKVGCEPSDLEGVINVAEEKPECYFEASLAQASLGGFFAIFCFGLVFRSNLGYTRYWEAATLIEQVRGEWFNATSSVFAFCAPDPSKEAQVSKFQHLFVRLMSMLLCAALHEVTPNSDFKESSAYAFIENDGIDPKLLEYVKNSRKPVEILLQWAERSIMDNSRNGVLDAPPPVLSRCFQELGLGMVTLQSARKVNDIPYPFPYAQVQTIMLMIFWLGFPVASATVMLDAPTFACFSCFLTMLVCFSTHYMALEIESPFGFKTNHLPLQELMTNFNDSLMTLLDKRSQIPPEFEFDVSYINPIDAVKENDQALDPNILLGKESHQTKVSNRIMSIYEEKQIATIKTSITNSTTGSVSVDIFSLDGSRKSSKDSEAVQREVSLAEASTHYQRPPVEIAAQQQHQEKMSVSQQPKSTLPFEKERNGEVAPASTTMSVPYSTFKRADQAKVPVQREGDESGPWMPLQLTQLEQTLSE